MTDLTFDWILSKYSKYTVTLYKSNQEIWTIIDRISLMLRTYYVEK